jgi:TonB family protein
MRRAATLLLSAGFVLALCAPARAQDEPKVAGTDVPAPRRTKFVAPAYPPEAQMRGQRGIVILELIVDEQGRVATADVVRSVPPFDDAALSAARQWEYEITQVDGKPVRVRVTVPITFALKLPEMTREEGIPEMRQGAAPGFPPGLEGPARVVADVTLLPDGGVAEAVVRIGVSPWAEGLLLALRTWRFAAPPEGTEVGFTVEANYVSPGRVGTPPRVELKLSDPRRRDAVAAADAGAAQAPPPAEAPVPAPAPAGAPTAAAQPPAAPAEAPPALPSPSPQAAATPAPTPAAVPEAPTAAPPSAEGPPVEVITGPGVPPPPPPPTPPPQPGFSAVRDVSLAIGVPDLVKGRRPVVPPLARMAAASGEVQVGFSVDAAGISQVQKVEGTEILQEAARQAVASWAFRRTSAERIFLSAVFTFQGDQARADVKRAE